MAEDQTTRKAGPYAGPAGVFVTPDEVAPLWELLNRNPEVWNRRLREQLALNYEQTGGTSDRGTADDRRYGPDR